MAGTDFSHLTNDELIKGIKALDLPDYIRSKAYGLDVRETLAQMTEMTIQLGVNMGLSPDDALKWARKLQETVSQSEFDSWVATLLDGGPSIFMNTLSELQTTYPNGAAGVALVRETDPAKIYVWNGTAWEDFGDYQGIEVKDNSITSSKIVDGAVTSAKKTTLGELPMLLSSGSGTVVNLKTSERQIEIVGDLRVFVRDKRYTIPSQTLDFSDMSSAAAVVFYYDTKDGSITHYNGGLNITPSETSVLLFIYYGITAGAPTKHYLNINYDYLIDGSPSNVSTTDRRTNLGERASFFRSASGGEINLKTAERQIEIVGGLWFFVRDKRYAIPAQTLDFSDMSTAASVVFYYDTKDGSITHFNGGLNITPSESSVLLFIYYGVTAGAPTKHYLNVDIDYLIDGRPIGEGEGATTPAQKPHSFSTDYLLDYYPRHTLPAIGDTLSPFASSDVTHTDVYALFDSLVSSHSQVTREEIGLSTNGIPIYVYRNTPKRPEVWINQLKPYPKIILLSSIHGGENLATYTLYHFFKNVIDGDGGEYVRDYINIEVIPLPNPEDFDTASYEGIDGINLNRDFSTENEEQNEALGITSFSRKESRVIRDYLADNKDALFFMDIHVRGMPLTEDRDTIYLGSSVDKPHDLPALSTTVERLTREWQSNYPELSEHERLGVISIKEMPGRIRTYVERSLGIPSILWEGFKATPSITDFEGSDIVTLNTHFLGETIFNLIKGHQYDK